MVAADVTQPGQADVAEMAQPAIEQVLGGQTTGGGQIAGHTGVVDSAEHDAGDVDHRHGGLIE